MCRCALNRNFSTLILIMSEGNSGDLQPEGAEDNVGKREKKMNCNGEVLRTSDPLKEGSTSGNKRQTDTRSGDVCSSADTQWAGDEQITSNSKDPTHNDHNSESTSSGDEGDFASNWYEPLPQDPRESDEDEEGEERERWSEAATGGHPLQGRQDGEKEDEGEGQGASVQQAKEVKAASLMEDSEL